MQVGIETINARRRSLNITIGVRLAVLALLGIFEGSIIARYTTNMGWGFWLIITIYAVVQVWPLARPPKDASDASVYSVWGIFSLICFIGVWTSTFTHHIPTSRLELGWYFTGP